jgi:hypothetical protein
MSVEAVWAMSDADIERRHNFIQWLFPLPKRSRFNWLAPLLSEADRALWQTDTDLRSRLARSSTRMLAFYRMSNHWQKAHNHNFLRATRIICCLKLCGLEEASDDVFRFFMAYSEGDGRKVIDVTTREFWRRARQGLV